jgi:hypothetical protein
MSQWSAPWNAPKVQVEEVIAPVEAVPTPEPVVEATPEPVQEVVVEEVVVAEEAPVTPKKKKTEPTPAE